MLSLWLRTLINLSMDLWHFRLCGPDPCQKVLVVQLQSFCDFSLLVRVKFKGQVVQFGSLPGEKVREKH